MNSNIKKILIGVAVLSSMQIANAQVKPEAARKAVVAAEAASSNPKKAVKAATWMNLGKAYMNAYTAPSGNIWLGAAKNEVALILAGEKPLSTEMVELNGEVMEKVEYANKILYYTEAGQLSIINVTEPVVEDALDKAGRAYKKAFELGVKKTSDIEAAINSISEKYIQDAYTAYSLGDFNKSSVLFEKAAEILAAEPVCRLDTNSIYNAGFTANVAGNSQRAKEMFIKCLENNYYSENGEIFAKLAEIDPENTKKYLEEGFRLFPQSQSILIGLINYYLQNKEDPKTLFTLLDQAKVNEPTNASLYYVEGNIHAQLNDVEAAKEAYRKCAEIDPAYEFGFIGEGILFYNLAIDIQTRAQEELNDAKYMALVKEFEQSLKDCIVPFEKAFTLSKDDSVKVSIAEYLKNAYYRFLEEDPANKEAYDKYAAIVKTGVIE